MGYIMMNGFYAAKAKQWTISSLYASTATIRRDKRASGKKNITSDIQHQ
jgi:hypothetical protein